jgi:hypothetical protein
MVHHSYLALSLLGAPGRIYAGAAEPAWQHHDAEDQAWRALGARFGKLSGAEWERPGATADWTPKDVLAHIACWHAEAVAALEAHRSGVKRIKHWSDVDGFNAEAYDRCKDLPLHDVHAMSGAARHRFREEIAIAEEPLPERIVSLIAGNAHGHYEEHIPLLDAFLGGA